MFHKINPYSYILFLAFFIILLTPALFTDGMFMDGTIYAVISRNLAEGNGSFWHLRFSDTLFSEFNEHPPLALAIESLFFKISGDTIYAERIYSLFTGIVSGFLIIQIINNFTNKKALSSISLFVWLSFPLTIWTFANNMLENTMTVFILLSAFFVIKSFKQNRILFLFISGIFLFAAFMSKGFPALFIWGAVFFYWLIYKKISFKRAFIDTFILVFFTIFPLILFILFSDEAKDSLFQYFNKQVIGSLENVKTVNSRLFIVGRMLNEMIISVIFLMIFFVIAKIKKVKIKFENNNLKTGLFFFFIALSGILPIMVSMKQRSFYIVPALPFLAISVSFFFINIIETFPAFVSFFKKRFFIPLSYGLLVVSIIMIFIFAGKQGRDIDKISDIYKMTKLIPEKEEISISDELFNDWSLYAYMQRYGKYSLSRKKDTKWFLTEKKTFSDTNFVKTDINLKKYSLYKKLK